MSRPSIDRLRDIVSSARLAQRYCAGLDVEALSSSGERRDAVLFRLGVVCEAATHLPIDVQALAPEVPWADIRGMRNYLVHSYWQIDFGIVLGTIRNDLESLATAATRLIAVLEQTAQ